MAPTTEEHERRTKGASTRAHLVDVAAELFAERGYESTSFSDLIAASGLSRGAFYFHFDSKHDLALAAFRDRLVRLRERVAEGVDPERPALERFRQLWMARARVVAEDPSVRCLGRVAEAFRDDPETMEEIAQTHAEPIRMMAELLAEAQADGDVRDDLDPVRAAEVALVAAIGMDEVSERESGMADLTERAESFLDVFLHGIIAH